MNKVLWTILVHPTRVSSHLECNGQLVDFGKTAPLVALFANSARVANQLVQICKVIVFKGKLIPKGIPMLNDMQSFLVQAIDIDIRGHAVALGFRVW